jgi:Uma2 family endonuclease
MSTIPAQPLTPQPTSLRMSYEEFLELGDEYRHAEWVNGEVVMMAAVTDKHDQMTMFLGTILKIFTEVRALGRVCREPFQMKTGPALPGRSPDIFFVTSEHLSRIRERNLEGPADFVIEIISEGTRRVDRVDKFQEYESGGVPEYWMLDPHRKIAEFFQLVNGRYEERNPDDQGIYRSASISGFWIDVNWLWQSPLPSTFDCLKKIGVV